MINKNVRQKIEEKKKDFIRMDKINEILDFIKDNFNSKYDFERYYEQTDLEHEKNKQFYTYDNLMKINKEILTDEFEEHLDFLIYLKSINFCLMDKETSVEFSFSGFFYNFEGELILFNEQ